MVDSFISSKPFLNTTLGYEWSICFICLLLQRDFVARKFCIFVVLDVKYTGKNFIYFFCLYFGILNKFIYILFHGDDMMFFFLCTVEPSIPFVQFYLMHLPFVIGGLIHVCTQHFRGLVWIILHLFVTLLLRRSFSERNYDCIYFGVK